MSRRDSFILELVYFAVGCAALGVILTFALVFVCQHFGINMYRSLWLLLIPVILSISLNICFLEVYRKYKKK
jgi:hypothetical protein